MEKPFNCLVCDQFVDPLYSHPACSKTCGSSECQAIYSKQLSKKMDQNRQRKYIEGLKKQGVAMVNCAVCNQEFEMIGYHHLKTHHLTVKEYDQLYPNSPRLNLRLKQQRAMEAIKRSNYLTYHGKTPDQLLNEFFTGCLLGDGSLEKPKNKMNARYAEGGNNEKYLKWKHEFLNQYFPCSFNYRVSRPHTKTGKQYQGWWVRTSVHPFLTELYSQWYQNYKMIPKDFITKYLTDFALAVWFCDDGCSSGSINFYTMSFGIEEVSFLFDLLNMRFGITGSILRNKSNQYFIRLNADSKRKFREIMSQFTIPGMEYKLSF